MSDGSRIIKRKPALSVSQVQRYLACPAKWKFKYVDKLPEERGVPLIYGSAIHEALAFYYDCRISGEGDSTSSHNMARYVVNAFLSALVPHRRELGDELQAVEDEGSDLLRMYLRDAAPTVTPILCEYEFDVDLGDAFPFRFIGKIDLVDEGPIIRDHKVVGRLPTQADVDNDIQLTGYATAYRLKFGEVECGLSFDILLKGKCEFHRIETTRTDAQCREFLNLLERIAGKIQREEFEPNPRHWTCRPQFCSYYTRCPGPLLKDEAATTEYEGGGTYAEG